MEKSGCKSIIQNTVYRYLDCCKFLKKYPSFFFLTHALSLLKYLEENSLIFLKIILSSIFITLSSKCGHLLISKSFLIRETLMLPNFLANELKTIYEFLLLFYLLYY